ncbi:TetR/AcrR family transcriptional regulator [Rhodococcus chondri]|uniref:TetR/AcrR family transcriptional regulator n=1 Tax=Rhodococcus chondri TaxID=3065941 RepID=A0ABU7JYW5_9NOCA|nr:TetR/AcrR family transcriptional regulator [Rhodococcus sp. CC-R104]MEE2035191.1 TetR/AcrR family transcriptional regulator [Rhodococcus sp. CC-R104]
MPAEPIELPVDEAVRAVRANSRRRQILTAAAKVMQRKGFHQMSMQALADEANVSVGSLYNYFGNKEEILLATITDILDAFQDQLEPAMVAAGEDPVERLAAGIRRFIEIVDENLDAVALTYRESRTLDPDGREMLKRLEIATSAPLRTVLTEGIDAGLLHPVDVDLMVFDLVLLAHGWSLKHWHFGRIYSLDEYIRLQTRYVLNTVVPQQKRNLYRHLMEAF